MPSEGARNRVLVGVPERLRKANMTLRKHETLIGQLRQLYSQRTTLNDSEIVDQMGALLGCEYIEAPQRMREERAQK